MVFKAHFDGKVLVPDEPVKLPKGEPLEIRVQRAKIKGRKKKLYELGSSPVKSGVADASVNHDKYIYTGF
ncbi:MAG TPA: hypothetical protein VGP72_14070 [Planctomycetota bacterium]|jgi:hypothetical protein